MAQVQPAAPANALVMDSVEVLEPLDAYSDSVRKRKIKRTILRSTFVPGWGQVTNKQFWKIPFVAAALGAPAYLFFDNLTTYKDLRQAYIYLVDTIPSNDNLIPQRYKVLGANSIRFYRDEFRKNVDYSVLVFILAWGLNVVDAAVFANLRDFDVSDKLSMRVKPVIRPGGINQVSLVFSLKNPKPKTPLFTR